MSLVRYNDEVEFPIEEEATPIDNESSKKSKLGIFVQALSDTVMEKYRKMKSLGNITKDSQLSILKCKKVRPRALIRTLEDFVNECKFDGLKENVKNTINQIEDMFPGGDAKLFVCHSKQNWNSALEFACIVVRKYRIETGEEAVDYLLTTYSYSKAVDVGGAVFGLASLGTSIGFGALTLATGGGVAIAAGVTCLLSGVVGLGATGAAFDTSVPQDMKEILEASFVYELVSRGHAIVSEDRRLYITGE